MGLRSGYVQGSGSAGVTTSVLDRLLAQKGKTVHDLNKNSTVSKMVFGKGVPPSAEINRIADLPRRTWQEDPDLDETVELMSEWLRRPGSVATLLPMQAMALRELIDYGCVGWLPVGEGKTLLSFLAGVVTEAERPLLLVPANLAKHKTPKELAHYREDWVIPRLTVMSYESLSVSKGEARLRAYAPDLIIADEAQALKNTGVARTRKLKRYMAEYPETGFLPMTGTPLGAGLRGVAHLFKWSLPQNLRPIPTEYRELEAWANALDYRVADGKRLAPGALTTFCTDPQEAQTLDGVRGAVGRRIVQTPGVIASDFADNPCPLHLEAHELDGYSSDTEDAFDRLHDLWETPDGHPFAEAVQLAQHLQELALGFYYRWNPYAPLEWLQARKDWCAQVREIIATNRQGLDSLFMVSQAVDKGKYDGQYLARWREIGPTFKPNSEAVWIDDVAVNFCANWLRVNKGICWVQHVCLGHRLAEVTGLPYYGAEGKDALRNTSIEDHKTGSIIASIQSNKKGRNLQDRFHRNLVTFWPSTATDSEQLMGRTHRKGQTADYVSFEVLMGCYAQWRNMQSALGKARVEQLKSGMLQKILLADSLLPDAVEIASKKGPRWRVR